jgi:hypothetical protein
MKAVASRSATFARREGDEPHGSLDGSRARLGRLRPGEQFAYVFDLGDRSFLTGW